MRLLPIALLALLWSEPARADDPAKRAAELNDQAMTAYDLGNYERSAELLKQAYQLYPEADLLYNLGRAYRSLKQYDKAIETYKAYLRKRPQSPYRAAIQKVIKEMEELQKAQEQSNEKPPTTMVPAPQAPPQPATQQPAVQPPLVVAEQRSWYEDWIGWSMVAAGAGGVGLGVGMHLSANSLEDTLATAPETEKQDIRDRIKTRRAIGTGGLIVGGLLLAGGIVKFWLTGSSSPEPQPQTSIVVGAGYVGVAGSF